MECFLNDKMVPLNTAGIAPTDLGFLRGYGVFDLALAIGNQVFLEKEHLKRLASSAKLFSLRLPYSLTEISKITADLMAKNNLDNSLVRWVLTGGVSANGKTAEKETFLILQEIYHTFPATHYANGVSAITVAKRREFPEAKSLNYQVLYSMYPKMNKLGAFEMIYTPDNEVLEASTSNVFLIKNNVLITPQNNILSGITRALVIKLARKNNIEIEERQVKAAELYSADELFITATNKRIIPVVKVDDKIIADGQPGKLTKQLISLFAQYEKAYFTKALA